MEPACKKTIMAGIEKNPDLSIFMDKTGFIKTDDELADGKDVSRAGELYSISTLKFCIVLPPLISD